MERYFLVLQPPFAEKHTFLVDMIIDKRNFGVTTDINKIRYNRAILSEDFDIEIKVQTLLSDSGVTSVFPLGRFITVLQIKNDESAGKMSFYDFDVNMNIEEFKVLLQNQFSVCIAIEWLKVYEVLSRDFAPEYDDVPIFKPQE